MERRQPLVKLVDIKKEFPGVKALKGVSLEILPGEVHGLVGENGAGKSTLIKIMMGAYTATSGEIYIDGERCGKLFPGLSAEKRRTGGLENHVSKRAKNA